MALNNNRIFVLDMETKNKIAAGEVIERPASVVKELVENAIDAGSTRIEVIIEGSGLKKIVVADDGCGIIAEEAALAFERHATSKIRGIHDLSKISSLGFRGEALPSIAAVSRIVLITKTTNSLEGTRVELEPSSETKIFPEGCPKGTTVSVKDLFHNTPARLKSLKALSSESAAITELLQKIALAHPEISFSYFNGKKQVFQTAGNKNLLETIISIFGLEVAIEMLKVKQEEKGINVFGYIGSPKISRGTTRNQIFIVNGRCIRHASLFEILREAYHTLLPIHQYPIAVINLQIPPELVDPNVHPTKTTVRFLEEDLILNVTRNGLKKALHDAKVIPELKKRTTGRKSISKDMFSQQTLQSYQATVPAPETGVEQANEYCTCNGSNEKILEEKTTYEEQFPRLHAIAQLGGIYILAQGPKGLYILDQHAAHERIIFEKLKNMFGEYKPNRVQDLTVPFNFELTPSEASLLKAHDEILRQTGITLEFFGGNSFVLRSLPVELNLSETENFIRELLEILLKNKGNSHPIIKEKVIILAACKSAVKANQHLSCLEMNYLLEQLAVTKVPYTCPHGRPTVISYSFNALQKHFQRS